MIVILILVIVIPGADLVHIDGDHDPAAARTDLRNAKAVARFGAWAACRVL